MGAFYIITGNGNLNEKVTQHFSSAGFSRPEILKARGIVASFYPKQCLKVNHRIEKDGDSLFITGTCIYKGHSYNEGTEALFNDLVNHSFKPSRLGGSYFFLFVRANGDLNFYSDPAGIQNIFFHPETGIISSSFLASLIGVYGESGKQKLNSEAIAEIITTGSLIGPDTMVQDILRYEPAIQNDLPGIKRLNVDYDLCLDNPAEHIDCEADDQLYQLSNYFKNIAPAVNELGSLSGLTGGFDSRLVYLLLKRQTNSFNLYTTYRAKPTNEKALAQQVASFFGDTVSSPPHKSWQQLKSDEFHELIKSNLRFNDGQIRTNQLWTEEIKSREYLKTLYGNSAIGMSGVGGEQYRNSEYLAKNRYNLLTWFYYENIYRHCGNPFSSQKTGNMLLTYITGKISVLLGKGHSNNTISFTEIKRYYNEIYNPANRTLRNNIENQLFLFLAPFTDYRVSRYAYRALTYLGTHHEFEKLMIAKAEPYATHLPLDYGYRIKDRVPLRYRIIPSLKALLGLKFYHSLYRLRKGRGNLLEKMIEKHPFLKKYIQITENLDLPISVGKVAKSNHLSPLLIEAGFFVEMMGEYLE